MTGQNNRPRVYPRPAAEAFRRATPQILPDAEPADTATPSRCGHRLTAPRSLARGMGPTCWARSDRGQLDARRDGVGLTLQALARRVASIDVVGLAMIAAGLDDVLAALDDRVVGS